MDKVTARGSELSPGRGRTTYNKDIITLHINSISLKLSKVNVTWESEQNLNIAMSPFPIILIILAIWFLHSL